MSEQTIEFEGNVYSTSADRVGRKISAWGGVIEGEIVGYNHEKRYWLIKLTEESEARRISLWHGRPSPYTIFTRAVIDEIERNK